MLTHLVNLNTEQTSAVEQLDAPLLVLAGAGTGKTRVIVSKIAHIIKNGLAWPNEILAVTFTNKAAKEMGHRIASLVEMPSPGAWFGTFHAVAAKILKINSDLAGLTNSFLIIDYDDQLKLVRSILRDRNIDQQQYNPKLILAIITAWKDQALTVDRVTGAELKQPAADVAKEVYGFYQARLKSNNLADFGDLLLHNLEIFSAYPEILANYQQRFKYILVDEYQDTNAAQHLWLRALARGNRNVCCVGDDDQSIYGWRGARVENILRFEEDFPGARVVRLEQNYRSSKYILQAASALISKNTNRYGKTLWTSDEEGHKLVVNNFWNDLEEAKYIAKISRQKASIYNANQMAVLVRASFQTRAIEEVFIADKIPYAVIGNVKFYERMEVRDVIAYIRLAVNNNDDLAFERIVNKPKRGVGDSALQKLKQCAAVNNCSLLKSIQISIEQNELKGLLKASLQEFVGLVVKWRDLFVIAEHKEVVKTILDDTKYLQMLELEKTSKEDAANRLDNVNELVEALDGFVSIQEFLEHISLVSDHGETEIGSKVNIMTLHAAKGLEFDLVFLPGWEEGIFPSKRTVEESGNIGVEEERRLAYVGITRARKEVHISAAGSRRVFNQWQHNQPSRFIKELPVDSCVTTNNAFSSALQQHTNHNTIAPKQPVQRKPLINQQVQHSKFGRGCVVSVSGNAADVYFANHGIKKIVLSFLETIN